MIEDTELLRRFAATRAEDAFAELVRRHLNLVYSAALRQVGGDHPLAEEVTQSVFTDLARKAASLSHREVVTGWLYTSTYYAATKAVRGESRRRQREQEAHLMQQTNATTEVAREWERLQPVLDDAMHELSELDRVAVLQRYFEGKAFPQIGATLGLTENAARMRVERALDKLRTILAARGIASTSAALAAVLGAQTVSAAPATLAATVVGASLAAVATTGGMVSAWSLFGAAKLKVAVPVACASVAVVALLIQHDRLERLRNENAAMLAGQQAGSIAPVVVETSKVDAAELARLEREHLELLRLRGEVGRLRREVAEARLKSLATVTNEVADDLTEKDSTQQINVKARFISGSKEDLAALGLVAESTSIFDENQTLQFLKAIEELNVLGFTSEMQVTTLSGRQAQLSATQSVTNREGVKTIGPVLEVLPRMQADGRTIEISFLGRREEDTQYVQSGIDDTSPLPVFKYPIQVVRAIVWDGQTVVATKQIADKPLVMLITPRLIDPAGNPLHVETERPYAETKPAQQ